MENSLIAKLVDLPYPHPKQPTLSGLINMTSFFKSSTKVGYLRLLAGSAGLASYVYVYLLPTYQFP